ncbi:MAG: RNA methyltransferase [Sphingobacteriaceae bacterium]|nr:RNA methyltransferase [Sphingobacteriaceae bacterium]
MKPEDRNALITYLEQFITEKRLSRFKEVLTARMGHMHVLLEDVFQGHNAAAVLRSCDCFGVQHVHFIQDRNQVKISDEIALGSSNWLTLHKHIIQPDYDVKAILRKLKTDGFRIIATTPHENEQVITDLNVDSKFVLVFGTELEGISDAVKEEADEFVKIPMYGFTESFNISVSAALCMYELSNKIRKHVPAYGLEAEEMKDVYLNWCIQSVETGELLVERWIKENKK